MCILLFSRIENAAPLLYHLHFFPFRKYEGGKKGGVSGKGGKKGGKEGKGGYSFGELAAAKACFNVLGHPWQYQSKKLYQSKG